MKFLKSTVAGRSRWPLVDGGSKDKEGGGFFFLLAEKMKDRGFFVLRTRKIEEFRPIFEEPPYLRRSPSPSLPFDLRPILRAKIEGGGLFDLRGRRSKIKDGGRFFDLRSRRYGRRSPSAPGCAIGPTVKISSRAPISIFGSIFKVGNRSEDSDLRIAEGSRWPLEGSEEERSSSSNVPAEKGEDRGFFVLQAEKVEDGRLFFLRTRKIECRNPPNFTPIRTD